MGETFNYTNPPLPGARHPAQRGVIKQPPAKLRRLRSVRGGIKKRLSELQDQLQPLYLERNRLRNDVDSLERMSKPFLKSDQGELERELKEAREGLAAVEEIIAEMAAERDEITADLNPLTATISSLEKHLGLSPNQHLIRPGESRMDRFDGQEGAPREGLEQATKSLKEGAA